MEEEDVPLISAEAAGVTQPPPGFESLDYDRCENEGFFRKFGQATAQERKRLDWESAQYHVLQWVLAFVIGVLTALVALCIDLGVRHLEDVKFKTIQNSIDDCEAHGCLVVSLLYFLAINCGFVLIAATLVAIAPVAAGSGIPEIKCYLNGIKIPEVVKLRTLLAKAIGVLFSVAGGLLVGKEGPMIHSGAIIAAGVTQGKSTSLPGVDVDFVMFRNDRAKRDFVSGGAAAGVAAAFGAPIGGVLFSLEEGSSFWNQSLTWRTFFCTMVSTFTLNIFVSGIRFHSWSDLSSPGLINFGKFEESGWTVFDLLIFVFMGAFGGIFGAGFNFLNEKLTVYRDRVVCPSRMRRLGEALLVCMTTNLITFLISMLLGNCYEKPGTTDDFETRGFFCSDTEYNDMATLAFNPQEVAIKQLFHQGGHFSYETLGIFFLMYMLLACWTYGSAVPSGLFVPCLLSGAAFGRLVSVGVRHIFPSHNLIPGTYALIGAASFLGGVVRMTISLTVILIESTNDINYGLPLMITLMVAKLVGDRFNESLYDIHIELRHIPLLGWESTEGMKGMRARDVMSKAPICVREVETVGRILDILGRCNHNGFPVTQPVPLRPERAAQQRDGEGAKHHTSRGIGPGDHELLPINGATEPDPTVEHRFVGMITRAQLLILLKHRAFGPVRDGAVAAPFLAQADFVREYPLRRLDVQSLATVRPEDSALSLDLKRYMGQCPFTVWPHASLARVFNLFRTMGLRHLTVVDFEGIVLGIIARKDLVHIGERIAGH